MTWILDFGLSSCNPPSSFACIGPAQFLSGLTLSFQPPVSAPFEAYLLLAFRPTTLLPSPPDLSSTSVFFGKLIKAGVKSMAITFGSLEIIPQPFPGAIGPNKSLAKTFFSSV
jgi:hypothetical protein